MKNVQEACRVAKYKWQDAMSCDCVERLQKLKIPALKIPVPKIPALKIPALKIPALKI